MIHVERLDTGRAIDAAALFVSEFKQLRRRFPMLSEQLEDVALVAGKLQAMGERGFVALEGGRPIGYLAWWQVERFRGSPRRGAYVPEWAHAAIPGRRAAIYRALYRAAAADWFQAGCDVHAITLLAHDEEAREAWFWNGFGMAVVDAARPVAPLDSVAVASLTIRLATPEDSHVLGDMDAEHVRHYTASPVFMAPPSVDTPAAFREFIERPKNSVWLAQDGGAPAGFMRFTAYDFDAVAVLESDSAAFCNGLFVRPEYRGRGAATGMLQAAITHYAGIGFTGLFVNFESFNPDAASFWPRYFRPVCISLMRIPETPPETSSQGVGSARRGAEDVRLET